MTQRVRDFSGTSSTLPAHEASSLDVTPMFIDGNWRQASDGTALDVVDPATEQIVARVPRATPDDVELALQAAGRGWSTWRSTGAWERSDALRRVARILEHRAQEIARVMTEEQGKPLREAKAELYGAWQQFDWFADEARRIRGEILPTSDDRHDAVLIREPIGPVAAFAPWNFPALLPARKLALALAAGCSIILKPADEAPRVAFELARACEQAGIPRGVVNVVTGSAPDISAQLIESGVIRKVTATSSVPVGRILLRAAAHHVLDATMELGGHAPVLVLPDVDPFEAAERCVAAKYRNAGQVCISPTRFFVHERIYGKFCDHFAERAKSLMVGPGADPATDVGPLGTRSRLDQVRSLIDGAVDAGARLLAGGTRPATRTAGYFLDPTVIAEVPDAAPITAEEPFGPVALIDSFNDLDAAVEKANSTPYGLAAYVLSTNLWTARRLAGELEAGMVGINHFALSYAGVPFGGVKSSGLGSESGASAINAYLVEKAVHVGPPLG